MGKRNTSPPTPAHRVEMRHCCQSYDWKGFTSAYVLVVSEAGPEITECIAETNWGRRAIMALAPSAAARLAVLTHE
jgi:hypothetical protein